MKLIIANSVCLVLNFILFFNNVMGNRPIPAGINLVGIVFSVYGIHRSLKLFSMTND